MSQIQTTREPRDTSSGESIFASLPIEIVEMIISRLPNENIVFSAPHLPTVWRQLIETSPHLRKRILDGNNFPRFVFLDGRIRGTFTTKLLGDGGSLIHVWYYLDSQQEEARYRHEFIFSPADHNAPLQVIDQAKSVFKYDDVVTGPWAWMELRDRNGLFACRRQIGPNDPDYLLRKYIRAKAAEQREAESTKRKEEQGAGGEECHEEAEGL